MVGRIKYVTYYSIIKFLGNLFKFKAETIFNRMNIQHILRIKIFFPTPKLGKLTKTGSSSIKARLMIGPLNDPASSGFCRLQFIE